ncbi:hypothetical protein [Cytobacillus solani]|uniref:Uncharacterized protein n=1 Tax=Cytobacillus solani TaxID=1637975 RepID=A0A0Q3VFC7_9BACI|nr:hypothetical protein [Cytobacillus solani]KQL17667.1 hypothetical protein AN957_02920 [Cytobacillus solani]
MNLPDKFFVEDEQGDIFLVSKEDIANLWWIQEDYTHEEYDCWDDCSGTMQSEILIERISSGVYKIIPDDEGWIDLN